MDQGVFRGVGKCEATDDSGTFLRDEDTDLPDLVLVRLVRYASLNLVVRV